jgi:ClpP class serine protease
MSVIEASLSTAWAITDDGMSLVASVASREHEYNFDNVEALESKIGRPLANTQTMTIRDGVALLPIQGALFAKDNIMTRWFGSSSYSTIATDFASALANPEVKAIVGVINSPGGQVDGVSELASLIKSASGTKPTVAFVEGTMASSALWAGSAFDKIVATDTAQVGSLGVRMGMRIKSPAQGEKNYNFVSSISPLKNADPESDLGAAAIKSVVDDLGMVFANTVAKNRNVKLDAVLKNFGQGAVVVAGEALARGMIDSIGTLESVISELSSRGNPMDFTTLNAATLAEKRPDLVALIGEQAVAKINTTDYATAERERIQSVLAQHLVGHEELVKTLAFDGKTTAPEAALQILNAERAKVEKVGADRASDAQKPIAQDSLEADVNANAEATSDKLDFIANAVELDKAAKQYMSANAGVTYLAAVKAVTEEV